MGMRIEIEKDGEKDRGSEEIKLSILGTVAQINRFYVAISEALPDAKEERIEPGRGLIYRLADKQEQSKQLAKEYGLTIPTLLEHEAII